MTDERATPSPGLSMKYWEIVADAGGQVISIVIAGDVVNGLSFWGPFGEDDNAVAWAEANIRDRDWVIADLKDPKLEPREDEPDEEPAESSLPPDPTAGPLR